MNVVNHIIFNFTCVFLLKNYNIIKFSNLEWNFILLISIISCLLPDIDHPNSYIGRKFKFISKIINKFFGHRKFTHSILFVFLIYKITNFFIKYNYKFCRSLYFGIIIGNLSHFLGDMFTKNGIFLFWPIKIKFKINFTKTIIILIIFILLIYNYN